MIMTRFSSRESLLKSRGLLSLYGCALVTLSAVALYALFMQYSNIPTADSSSHDSGNNDQHAKVTVSATTPQLKQTAETNLHQPSPNDFASTKSLSSPLSHLLNVPFYVYDELYWLDEGTVGNNTGQYFVENMEAVKHTDDYWFAKAAMIHPKRVMDPSEAKLFIVPTLLNLIWDRPKTEHLCFQQMCNHELMRHVDTYLANSYWFQQNQGRDHVIVASQSASEWYIPSTLNIRQCNMLVWGNRNYGFPENHGRVLLPKLYAGRACPHVDQKQTDFAMIASMHKERPTFASRSNICAWMKLRNNNDNYTAGYTMASCGQGLQQCPALANARFGFHVRGDTFGSNRLIDTLLSGTVPVFTWMEQYEMLADWIDWKMLSYYANVSNQAIFLSDIDRIVADKQGYEEKHKHVVLNRDLFDWKTTIPFDTYMYMLSVHLWPELELERRKTQTVSSRYTALILPRFAVTSDEQTRYLPFLAFDFQRKTVTCGGEFSPGAKTCEECPSLNDSIQKYTNSSFIDHKWPRFDAPCGKSCLKQGDKCVHHTNKLYH